LHGQRPLCMESVVDRMLCRFMAVSYVYIK
jgi:hypothetical protein